MLLAFHENGQAITWPVVAIAALVVVCVLGVVYFLTKD